MRPLNFLLLVLLFMVGTDLYALRGIQHLFPSGPGGHGWITAVYWGLSGILFAGLLWAGQRFRQLRDPSLFFGVMVVMGVFLMIYVPKLLFNLFQLGGDLASLAGHFLNGEAGRIRRGFLWPGAIAALLLMSAFGLGMVRGRNHVKVFREEIPVRGLPEPFSGLRIVQISDLHLAGFYHHPEHIHRVVEMINQLEPDLLLFTGDMVHNFSEEIDPFVDELRRLSAPLGKYAILGNHDYGHYYGWKSVEEERTNLERVKSQIRAAGFDLLLNEFRPLLLKGQIVELLGVENWGKGPFPQHGDLEAALKGTDPSRVKILMSHDPSHWDLEVKGKAPVPLTLSGHTHGMQFGLELGRFRWSPSKWTYRYWAGLYQENGQYLYVNRGLGFTGYPGRVGIRPEITLLTLLPD